MTQTVLVKFSYDNRVSEEIAIKVELDLTKNSNRKKLLNRLLKSYPAITEVTLLSWIKMTFIDALIASGYVLDEDNFDDGCYVKTDFERIRHIYQIGEDEGEWNYVKMSEDYDVLTEVTFNPDTDNITL